MLIWALFVSTLLMAQMNYDQLLATARAETDARRYRSAVTASEKAIAMDPARWDAYAIRGVAQQQLDYAAAIISFSQAIALAPTDKKVTLQRLLEETVAAKTAGSAVAMTPAPQPQAAAAASFVEIRGYVLDHATFGRDGEYNGKRVAGADVVARRLDVPQTFTARTESNGEFRIFHLPVGEYTFEAHANGKHYVPQVGGGFRNGITNLRLFTKEYSGLSEFIFALELPQL